MDGSPCAAHLASCTGRALRVPTTEPLEPAGPPLPRGAARDKATRISDRRGTPPSQFFPSDLFSLSVYFLDLGWAAEYGLFPSTKNERSRPEHLLELPIINPKLNVRESQLSIFSSVENCRGYPEWTVGWQLKFDDSFGE